MDAPAPQVVERLYSGYGEEKWCGLSKVEIREMDEQGRVIVPKKWRSTLFKGDKVVLKLKDDSIEIVPLEKFDLTRFFDSVAVDLKSNLTDWDAVRTELRRTRREIRR